MNPFHFAKRRPFFTTLLLIAILAGCVFGMDKMRADILPAGPDPQGLCLHGSG